MTSFDSPQVTIYGKLLDRALEKPIPEWNEGIEMHLRGLASALSRYGEEAMREAYIAGVRDGFVQGVAAQIEELPA